MTDLSTTLTGDPAPATTAPVPPAVAPPVPPSLDLHTALPPGIHPQDASVPVVDGQLQESDKPPGESNLGPQGQRRVAPWDTDNEEAFPVYQRSAHDWSANAYTVTSASSPIQIAGRLKGCVSTVVWVPASSAQGVVISPVAGDIQQGAGVTLYPGDSIEIPSEGSVWCGVIVGQASGGPVQVTRYYNPPGGGLGLSAS